MSSDRQFKCPNREENILDHCYTSVSRAYHAIPRAALGHSDHVMVRGWVLKLGANMSMPIQRISTRPNHNADFSATCYKASLHMPSLVNITPALMAAGSLPLTSKTVHMIKMPEAKWSKVRLYFTRKDSNTETCNKCLQKKIVCTGGTRQI